MDTEHDTRPPGGPPPPGPRPALGGLTRASDDTVISGLCGGLGRHFGIDPIVFRIAFVVMALAGGTGLLLYLVGWALVPDDQGGTFAARWIPGHDRGRKLVAAGLAGIGVLILLDRITDGHGDDIPLGLVLVGLGAAVLWSRRDGRTPPTFTAPPPPPPPPPPWPPAVEAESVVPTVEVPGTDGPDEPVADNTTASGPTTPPAAGSSAWTGSTTATLPAAPLPAAPRTPVPPPVYTRRERKAARPHSALAAVTLSLLAILVGVVVLAGIDLVVGLALALALVAGAMIVGAWRGRARSLIPVAVLLSGALLVASLIDVPFKGGSGEKTFRPVSVAELRSPYRLVAGELVLDLSGIDPAGRRVPVVASIVAGTITVVVPEGMAVEVDAHVGAGDMLVFDREWEGVDLDERVVRGGSSEGAGAVLLDAEVGLGQLEVRRAAA